MNWLYRVLSADILERKALLLEMKVEQLERERAQRQLEYARSTRDLIENFWIVQEGGIDVREPLLNGLRDLNDEVARLEEHTL